MNVNIEMNGVMTFFTGCVRNLSNRVKSRIELEASQETVLKIKL